MATPENPPAFPRDHRFDGHNGMTLRDYFAGQALAGVLANSEAIHAGAEPTNAILFGSYGTEFAKQVAEMVGRIADAMLAERANAEGR